MNSCRTMSASEGWFYDRSRSLINFRKCWRDCVVVHKAIVHNCCFVWFEMRKKLICLVCCSLIATGWLEKYTVQLGAYLNVLHLRYRVLNVWNINRSVVYWQPFVPVQFLSVLYLFTLHNNLLYKIIPMRIQLGAYYNTCKNFKPTKYHTNDFQKINTHLVVIAPCISEIIFVAHGFIKLFYYYIKYIGTF